MPKIASYRTLPYSGEIWNYNRVTGTTAGSTTNVYFLLRETKLDLTQGVFGKINIFLPNEASDIMQEAQIRNLVDRDGQEVFPDGIWVFAGLLPVLNVFGQREGFRGQANLTFVE